MTYIEEPLYKEILESMPIACIDIAIVANGRVLLVQRNDPPARGQWWLPGGRVWKGEKMRETAGRKAREEVGIPCHVGPIIHTAETIFPDGPYGCSIHSINSCFFLYPVGDGGPVVLDAHHAAFRWVDSIPPDVHPYVRDCLLGAGLEYGEAEP